MKTNKKLDCIGMLLLVAMVFLSSGDLFAGLKDSGCEDFSGGSSVLDDWTFYSFGQSTSPKDSSWIYNAGGWAEGLSWGYGASCARVYTPAGGYEIPAEGYFEMKVMIRNDAQETGILVKASGSEDEYGAGSDFWNGIAFGIKAPEGTVMLRDYGMSIGYYDVGTLPGFAIDTWYILRLTWNGSEFYGEIYDETGTTKLFTSSTITNVNSTGNTVGFYMGNDGASGAGWPSFWDDARVVDTHPGLKDSGYEDFSGGSSVLNDWTFYSFGQSSSPKDASWIYNAGGWAEGLSWGYGASCARVYTPAGGYEIPAEGYFEMKVMIRNDAQETGILVKASGSEDQYGAESDFWNGVAFGIQAPEGTVMLRDYGMSIGYYDVGTLPGFAIDTWYILRLTWNGNEFYGEIYDETGTTKLFTSSTITNVNSTGNTVGFYMGNTGASGAGWPSFWDDARVVDTHVPCPGLKDGGYEDFSEGSSVLDDWTFYSFGQTTTPKDSSWIYNTGGWVEGLSWGYGASCARVYTPEGGYEIPANGYFEMKVMIRNDAQETGILAKALGLEDEYGVESDFFNGVAFGIQAPEGTVMLRDWGMSIGYYDKGTLPGFAIDTWYILRLTWNGSEFYGEIFDETGTNKLFTSSTITNVNAGGTSVGFYMGNTGNSGAGWPSFWDDARVVAETQMPGDANGDGMVDVGDLGILAANYGGTGKTWSEGDFNGDEAVDVGDLGILAANYGTGTSGADWDVDYAKAFGDTVADEVDDEGSAFCGALGLPLIAGLFLAGLMLSGLKIEE